MRDRDSKKGGSVDGGGDGPESEGLDRRQMMLLRIRQLTARSNRWHAQHPEWVAEFNRLTNNACADGAAGISFRALRTWQDKNGVSPVDGLLGPGTIETARKLGAQESANSDTKDQEGNVNHDHAAPRAQGSDHDGASAPTTDGSGTEQTAGASAQAEPAHDGTDRVSGVGGEGWQGQAAAHFAHYAGDAGGGSGGKQKPAASMPKPPETETPPDVAAALDGGSVEPVGQDDKHSDKQTGQDDKQAGGEMSGHAQKAGDATQAAAASGGAASAPGAATESKDSAFPPAAAGEGGAPPEDAARPFQHLADGAADGAKSSEPDGQGADGAAVGGHADLDVGELHLDTAFIELAPMILQSHGLKLPAGAIEMIRPLIFDEGKLRKELFEGYPKAKAAHHDAKKHAKGGEAPRFILLDLLQAVMAPHAPTIRAIVESIGGGEKKEGAAAAGGAAEHAPAGQAQTGGAQAGGDAGKGHGDPKQLLDESRKLMGDKDAAKSWGTDGSVKDEGLQHPAFVGNAAKNGYEGSFKCNIFVGEALFRSGFMSPGSDEDHQPTHHYSDVNEIVSDIEAVASGGKSKHGAQWFDVVDKKDAQPGDILVIRGKYREDVHPFMDSGDENHGHIEILSDVEREDGAGQIRHIKTIGAGSKTAHETSHDGRTTFGHEKKGDYNFNEHTWVIRPRLR